MSEPITSTLHKKKWIKFPWRLEILSILHRIDEDWWLACDEESGNAGWFQLIISKGKQRMRLIFYEGWECWCLRWIFCLWWNELFMRLSIYKNLSLYKRMSLKKKLILTQTIKQTIKGNISSLLPPPPPPMPMNMNMTQNLHLLKVHFNVTQLRRLKAVRNWKWNVTPFLGFQIRQNAKGQLLLEKLLVLVQQRHFNRALLRFIGVAGLWHGLSWNWHLIRVKIAIGLGKKDAKKFAEAVYEISGYKKAEPTVNANVNAALPRAPVVVGPTIPESYKEASVPLRKVPMIVGVSFEGLEGEEISIFEGEEVYVIPLRWATIQISLVFKKINWCPGNCSA